LNDPRTGVFAINPSNQMWNWNGADWTQLNPEKPPAAREDAAMVYDGATSQLILFGGMGTKAVGDLGDTWSWSGSSWTHLSPGPAPPARSGAGVAYDAAAKALVLEGGASFDTTNGTLPPLSDQWVWNGSRWLAQSGAPGGYLGALAFDAHTGQLVLLPPNSTSTWLWIPLEIETQALPSAAVGSRHLRSPGHRLLQCAAVWRRHAPPGALRSHEAQRRRRRRRQPFLRLGPVGRAEDLWPL
jgi:hypothetical protein